MWHIFFNWIIAIKQRVNIYTQIIADENLTAAKTVKCWGQIKFWLNVAKSQKLFRTRLILEKGTKMLPINVVIISYSRNHRRTLNVYLLVAISIGQIQSKPIYKLVLYKTSSPLVAGVISNFDQICPIQMMRYNLAEQSGIT